MHTIKYGMNHWDTTHDRSAIPLMNSPHGYQWFWMWCLIASCGIVLLVRYQMSARTRKWG